MFFKNKEAVPAGVGFSTFGAEHIIWLVALAAVCAAVIIFYKRSDTKRRNVIRISLGWTIVALEVIKDIVLALINDLGMGNLPLHLCGINILLICFDIFKPTRTVRNFLYYFSVAGAMLALLFPNWTALPCMNFFNIHSFTIHAFLVLYPLLLVFGGELRPRVKDMPKCIILLVCMAIPIYFINLKFDTNFMFLMDPETGNPLGLFEQYLGSHLWGFPILLPMVMFIMYLPIHFISKAEKKKKAAEKSEITV